MIVVVKDRDEMVNQLPTIIENKEHDDINNFQNQQLC
jgi:hypothetical protein